MVRRRHQLLYVSFSLFTTTKYLRLTLCRFIRGPSEDVALRLARNLKLELGSAYTLSETGWAGPTGRDGHTTGSVGSVFYAVVSPKTQTTLSKELENVNPQDRAGNMAQFAKMGLEFLLEVLEKED